ncbi:hypothetical protein D3C74_49930 [compost metagenome]
MRQVEEVSAAYHAKGGNCAFYCYDDELNTIDVHGIYSDGWEDDSSFASFTPDSPVTDMQSFKEACEKWLAERPEEEKATPQLYLIKREDDEAYILEKNVKFTSVSERESATEFDRGDALTIINTLGPGWVIEPLSDQE